MTEPPERVESAFSDAFARAFETDDPELPERPNDIRLVEGDAGRWTKFTPARVAYVLAALRAGQAQTTAARMTGVTPRTLKRWKAKGRTTAERLEAGEVEPADLDPEDRLLARFYVAVEAARGSWAAEAVEHLQTVGYDREEGDWRALLELLKRQQPNTFGTAASSGAPTAVAADGGTVNIAIKIDGGPPEGVEQDPEERTRLVLDEAGNVIEKEGPDDAA